MSQNIQMVVTVLLLVLATVFLLREDVEEIQQEFSLHIGSPDERDQYTLLLGNVNSTYAGYVNPQTTFSALEIDDITFKVKSYKQADLFVLSEELQYAAAGQPDYRTIGFVKNSDIRHLAVTGEARTVQLVDIAAKDELERLMMEGRTISFRLKATEDRKVDATLSFTIHGNRKATI